MFRSLHRIGIFMNATQANIVTDFGLKCAFRLHKRVIGVWEADSCFLRENETLWNPLNLQKDRKIFWFRVRNLVPVFPTGRYSGPWCNEPQNQIMCCDGAAGAAVQSHGSRGRRDTPQGCRRRDSNPGPQPPQLNFPVKVFPLAANHSISGVFRLFLFSGDFWVTFHIAAPMQGLRRRR